jgi:hypothetical protein
MKRGVAILIGTAATLSAQSATAAPCQLADLGWLAGTWRDDGPTTKVEERWALGPGGRLMGSSWVLHTDKPGGVVEAETIQAEGDTVALRIRHFSSTLEQAREDKDAPMTFLGKSCEGGAIVLDGQGTQAGEHITYRRDGDRLSFVGDFLHDGKPVRAEATFTRAGD